MTKQTTAQLPRSYLRAFFCTLSLFSALLSYPSIRAETRDSANSSKTQLEDILKKADDVRCPAESFFMEVEIETRRNKELTRLEVFTKGRDKTRINTLQPVRDRKRSMIMVGDEMWAYVPNLKRAVLVSMAQKMSGETAIGDVSRMRWWGDYTPTLVSEDSKVWTLKLTANRKGLTYDTINAWIEKETYRPLQAEYRSRSGMLIKTSKFSEYKSIAGEIRPTVIHFEDARVASKSSILRITKLEKRDSPDAIFDPKDLKGL